MGILRPRGLPFTPQPDGTRGRVVYCIDRCIGNSCDCSTATVTMVAPEPEAAPLTPSLSDAAEAAPVFVLWDTEYTSWQGAQARNWSLPGEHRELIHKIGVTGGRVETRIAGADKDATYLLADVEVVATYKLHNLNRTRLENIFHRLFGAAQLDLTIEDRFGHPVKPREWFLVPLHVIDEAVERIRDGSITGFAYDPQTARLVSEGAIKA